MVYTVKVPILFHRESLMAALTMNMRSALDVLQERLQEAGLPPSFASVLEKPYVFCVKNSPHYVLAGKILAIDVSNDDGVLELCVSNPHFRGSAIRSIAYVNGKWELWFEVIGPVSNKKLEGEILFAE